MSKECSNCDSTSMEMCLLVRKCPYWVDRPTQTKEKEKADEKQYKG